MGRIRMTALAVATAASVAAIPIAIAAASEGGHHSEHAKSGVVYRATGVVASPSNLACGAGGHVDLIALRYSHNTGQTNGGPLTVQIDGSTTFRGVHHAALLCSAIATNDRLQVIWKESAPAPAFAPSLVATRVIDLGPATVTFTARGLATSPAVCTPTPQSLALNTVTYSKNTGLTTDASLNVILDGSTKFRGHGEHHRGAPAAGCAGIQTNDRIVVTWKESYNSSFSKTAIATSIRDLGPARPVHYRVSGIANGAASCAFTVSRASKNISPALTGTFTPLADGSTKFIGIADCSKVASGDHLIVTYTEAPGTTAFSASFIATKIIDVPKLPAHTEHRR